VRTATNRCGRRRQSCTEAIRRVYIRILVFYILGTFIIGILVPSTDPGLKLGSTVSAASHSSVIECRR
jgi:amino acid transporter